MSMGVMSGARRPKITEATMCLAQGRVAGQCESGTRSSRRFRNKLQQLRKKPPGLHTTAREPKRAHLSAPALRTQPKFNEKTPREGRKERILRREREKKRAKFWAVQGKCGPGEVRVQGKCGPGKGGSWEGRSWESRSWEGRFRGHRT